MVIGDFGKLSFERQSEFIIEMKRSEKFYSFVSLYEMSDFSADEIEDIFTGRWSPDDDGHIGQKFTEMIKDSVFNDVYIKTPAKDVVSELAEKEFNSLTPEKRREYIGKNLPQMQRYLAAYHSENDPLRSYFTERTVCINKFSEYDGSVTKIPKKGSRFARWYRLDDEDVLFELKNSDCVTLFDDLSFSKSAYLVYYNEQHRRERDSRDGVLDICENADFSRVRDLMEKYGLKELRRLNINDVT